MKIKEITYNIPLSEIEDIENDNVDVFVKMDDGMTYAITAFTPKNYYWYMDKENLDFVPISSPNIIVRRLTDQTIREAIQSCLEDDCFLDGYWLKLYHLAPSFDIKTMNKMIEEIKNENEKIFSNEF